MIQWTKIISFDFHQFSYQNYPIGFLKIRFKYCWWGDKTLYLKIQKIQESSEKALL